MSWTSTRSVSIGAVIGIGIVASLGMSAILQHGQVRNSGTALPPESESAAMPTLTEALKLPGETHQLTYDIGRDALWFAVMDPVAGDWIFELDPRTLRLRRWELPRFEGNGFLSQVRVSPDGAIWITEDYRLVRFDPEDERMSSLDLDLRVDGALPGALDPNSPLPGTWISAMAPTASGALIARMGVPFLTEVSRAMQPVGTIPLPSGFAGARDIAILADGSIAALSGWAEAGRLALLTAKGDVKAISAASELAGNSRLVSDSAGQLWISRAPAMTFGVDGKPGSVTPPSQLGVISEVAMDPRGGESVYSAIAGAIYRVGDGLISSSVLVPPITGTVTHKGVSMKVTEDPDIRALAVDVRGTTWFVVGRNGLLMRTNL